MPDALYPALHGRHHRDEYEDQISGPWETVINAGGSNPDGQFIELQNGWAQPASPLQEFAFRRGLSKLDFTGHLDSAGASSGTVAFTLPADYRLLNDQFFLTVLDSAIPALVYLEASTGDVTITFPV